MNSPSNHRLLYLDTKADWAINLVKTFYSAFPSLKCFDLASLAGQPFGFDSSLYNSVFVSETLFYYNKFLFWDPITSTHVNYMCIDAKRADAMVDSIFAEY